MHLAVDGYGFTRPRGGTGTYTREILSALAAARPEARLEVYVPTGVDTPADTASMTWFEQPSVRFAGRHLAYPAAVRSRHPDVFFGPAGHLPLASTGVPEVVTVHDLAIYRHPEWFPAGQPLATRLVVPRSLRRARALIAVSESTARDTAGLFGVARSRITVVHHGVAPRYRPVQEAQLAAVRARLGLPERYVLFVGTIEPRKNLQTLVEAWSGLPERPPLVIAGGWGWRHEEIETRLRAAPGVHLVGEVDPADLPALYGGAACLAHPAWYEGFGLTVLEAMACGTPVVSSDTSSLPEVGGDSVLYAAPGDPAGWRAALERVLGDPDLAAELRRRGLERAAGFTWPRAAEATWEVIEAAV